MTCRLGFAQTEDGQLQVVTEFLTSSHAHAGLAVSTFPDEGLFLYYLVLAELGEDLTSQVISNILLVLSGRAQHTDWIEIELSALQVRYLGLSLPTGHEAAQALPTQHLPSEAELRDVMVQAPIPVTMMTGPQHTFNFINPAYVRLLGRNSAEEVLGKGVREVLPELEGQRFFNLLDQVYRTGEPYVGREVPASLRVGNRSALQEFYFDFVYYPVRDKNGFVSGILCQATDVTDRVLARQVSEAREAQLYRQWAELEAIYRGAPVAMALVDVREYRFLRVNDTNAALLGRPAQELLGRKIFDVYPQMEPLRALYQRVASGEEIRHIEVELFKRAGAEPQRLLLNFSPVLDSRGRVEAIASITIDYMETIQPRSRITLQLNPVWSEAEPATEPEAASRPQPKPA